MKRLSFLTKKNLFLVLSAASFFGLYNSPGVGYAVGFVLALLILILYLSQYTTSPEQRHSIPFSVFILLSALGISWCGAIRFVYTLTSDPGFHSLSEILPEKKALSLAILLLMLSLYFICWCLSLFWERLFTLVKEAELFRGISKTEYIVYSILFLCLIIFTVFCFTRSNAFYGASYDVLYTSDSKGLVDGTAWLSLTHSENDLRQPLFAVFSAPFTGLSFLVSMAFQLPLPWHCILLNIPQLGLMLISGYLLGVLLNLKSASRICFVVCYCSTYSFMLFTVMMEQYIIACFWLILCITAIVKKKTTDPIVLYAAGGSLLTSIILLPIYSFRSHTRSFWEWVRESFFLGIGFLIVMLAFCRFDVFYDIFNQAASMTQFTGQALSFQAKLAQYTFFIRNCFLSPLAGLSYKVIDHVSWQLAEYNTFSIAGIAVLILCAVSFAVNWKDRFCIIAAGWIVFSFILLVIMGWGTIENGLILYSLYFGWAFLVMIVLLIKTLTDRLPFPWVLPVFLAFTAGILLYKNLPGMRDLLLFAMEYFPV